MLTPEEVRELLLPVDLDYLIEHGIDSDSDALEDGFYTDKNGIYHYQRVMDKETFTPFNGLLIHFSEDDPDRIEGYAEMKEGYPLDDVDFYVSGALYRYEHHDESEHYFYIWYESGALKLVTVWHRRDKREYSRSREYDETGRLISQSVYCEIKATYEPDAADSPFDFTFHENGEFRTITKKAPTPEDFYTGIELDPDGYPVRISVNPHYIEASLDKQLNWYRASTKTFNDKTFRVQDGRLEYLESRDKEWYSVNCHVLFRDGMHGYRLLDYRYGILYGPQSVFYPSGQIQEDYGIDSKGEYRRHVHWYPNGIMREAIVYSHYDVMLHVTFDGNGNLLSYALNSDVFKQTYKK